MGTKGIRLLFAGTLFAIATLLPASGALAGPQTPQMIQDDITFVDDSCGFPVTTHVVLKYVNHFDANGQVTMNNWDVHWTYTNPANGVTLQVVTNGPNQYTYNADGSVTTTLMGAQVKVI